jgi:predicted ATPase
MRGELIRPERSDFADDDGYRFAHVLIRDAMYDSTPKELRAELHERYANWLERKAGDRVREYEEILGYHLEQACRYRRELVPVDERTLALARRAAMRLAAAGRRARARDDLPAAVALLSRAVSLLAEGDVDRLRLLPDLGEAIARSGDYRGANTVLEEAIERAEAAGDERTQSYGLLFRVYTRTHTDPGFTAEEALSETQRALRLFEELGDEGGQALAWAAGAAYQGMRGQFEAARESSERAVEHATAVGDKRLQDEARTQVAHCLFHGAASLDKLDSYAERLDHSDSRGGALPFRQLIAQNLGQAHAMRGQFETARALMAEAVAAFEDVSNTFWPRVSTALGFGAIEVLAGDSVAAERHLRDGFSALVEAGETGNLSTMAALLAEAVDAQGRHAEAERYTRISEEAAARDDYASQILWRTVRAKAFAGQGRVVEGERLAREGVTLAEGTDDINMHGDALMGLAQVVRLGGLPGEAAPLIQQALHLYEQKGNLVWAGNARALLAELQVASEP